MDELNITTTGQVSYLGIYEEEPLMIALENDVMWFEINFFNTHVSSVQQF